MEDLANFDEIQKILRDITMDGPSLLFATPSPPHESDIASVDPLTKIPPELDDGHSLHDNPSPPAIFAATSMQTSRDIAAPKLPTAKR
jgi:hypothetical protein